MLKLGAVGKLSDFLCRHFVRGWRLNAPKLEPALQPRPIGAEDSLDRSIVRDQMTLARLDAKRLPDGLFACSIFEALACDVPGFELHSSAVAAEAKDELVNADDGDKVAVFYSRFAEAVEWD